MTFSARFVSPAVALVLVALVACSSSRDDAVGGAAAATADGGGGGGVTAFADGATRELASCVTTRRAAELSPVNLVFMFDQSGSMGDEGGVGSVFFGFKRSERWDPVTNGLKRFFSAADSAGIRASLQYFPSNGGGCDALQYKTPEVPLTALPNPSPFVVSINSHGPAGGTPTLPAVAGAILYAKELKAQYPLEKAAVVLVTDGEPSECGSIEEVKARLAADAPEVQTYIVGVGKQLTALADLAKAGGTGAAILIDLQNPQQSSDDFLKALATIRGQALSCSMPIPAAPQGQTLDASRVNVALSSATSAADVLTYDATCASPDGWRYDDANAPKSIELCPGSCERARVLAGGAIEVQLGCVTKGIR